MRTVRVPQAGGSTRPKERLEGELAPGEGPVHQFSRPWRFVRRCQAIRMPSRFGSAGQRDRRGVTGAAYGPSLPPGLDLKELDTQRQLQEEARAYAAWVLSKTGRGAFKRAAKALGRPLTKMEMQATIRTRGRA